MATDLSIYSNVWYKPGSFIKRFCWHYVNTIIFRSGLFPFYYLKIVLLKAFGAKVGKGVLIKPFVNIKYPWLLIIGDFVWIGENVWIDNLATIVIGNNVCLSQGTTFITGNHDYKKPGFDLSVNKIVIDNGVWIGAKSTVGPGVWCKSHSVLTIGSVATKNLEEYSIYSGNPAVKLKDRVMNQKY